MNKNILFKKPMFWGGMAILIVLIVIGVWLMTNHRTTQTIGNEAMDSDMDIILLYDEDPRYVVNKDIEPFLQTIEGISDWMTYNLPENLAEGRYNAQIGNGGGVLFQWTGKEEPPVDEYGYAPAEWQAAGGALRIPASTGEGLYLSEYLVFEDGIFVNANLRYNHTSIVSDPEPVTGCETQAIIFKMNHDLYTAAEIGEAQEKGILIPEEEQTVNMWYVFFAREGADYGYCIYLSENYFTKEDVIEMARSVRFTDKAFPYSH